MAKQQKIIMIITNIQYTQNEEKQTYKTKDTRYETVWNQGYQVVSGEDKNHSSGLILSDHDFFGQINPKIRCSPDMHHV